MRIFGTIHLVLGLYMILDGLVAMGDIADLPGPAAKMVGGVLGIAAILIVWGGAAASGLGMILLTQWGRWLAIMWGKMVVWVLPIAFGLSSDGLSDMISVAFAVIIIIGLYAVTIATNLERPEFDIAFESAPPAEAIGESATGNEDEEMQPAIRRDGAAPEKIRFECKKCGKQYAVRPSLVGKKATCKECGHKFRIPAKSTR